MKGSSDQPYAITILSVDDDPTMLDLVSRYLTTRGIRVVTTPDPETVINLAIKEKPRLILTDLNMPGIDGVTLLKTLKNHPDTRHIPVILLTSSRESQDVQSALNAGAEAYLVKPVDWELSWPKIQSVMLGA